MSATCTDPQPSLLTAFTAGCLLQQPLQCLTALSSRVWGHPSSSQNLYFKTGSLLHGVFSRPLTNKEKKPSHDQQKSTIFNCRLQQAPHLPSANLHLFFSAGLTLNSKFPSHHPPPKQARPTAVAFTCSWTDVHKRLSSPTSLWDAAAPLPCQVSGLKPHRLLRFSPQTLRGNGITSSKGQSLWGKSKIHPGVMP